MKVKVWATEADGHLTYRSSPYLWASDFPEGEFASPEEAAACVLEAAKRSVPNRSPCLGYLSVYGKADDEGFEWTRVLTVSDTRPIAAGKFQPLEKEIHDD